MYQIDRTRYDTKRKKNVLENANNEHEKLFIFLKTSTDAIFGCFCCSFILEAFQSEGICAAEGGEIVEKNS